MPLYIRICLAIDLILIGSEHAVPVFHGVLPLGGNPLMQFAILMCFGIAALELGNRKPPHDDKDADDDSDLDRKE